MAEGDILFRILSLNLMVSAFEYDILTMGGVT
jgi:hypothetical protein